MWFSARAMARIRLRSAIALACVVCAAICSGARPARAESGTQTTPDGLHTLISKDLGGERWAITLNLRDGTVTGNVFHTDGSAPTFVWCERVSDDGRLDPTAVEIAFRCLASDPCTSSPCDADSWRLVDTVKLPGEFFLPALDPFSPLQTPQAYCDPIAHQAELLGDEPTYGVESLGCNYLTVVQPTLAPIRPGDRVFLRLFHFVMQAPTPSVAYVAVRVGDHALWSAEIPIPSAAELMRPLVRADFGAPAGSPIYFHVQNHGANSYHLLEVRVGGENGTPLVTPFAWTTASIGLPYFPPSF
jgi:hypothetical protein